MNSKVSLSSLGKKKVAVVEDNKELRDGFDFYNQKFQQI